MAKEDYKNLSQRVGELKEKKPNSRYAEFLNRYFNQIAVLILVVLLVMGYFWVVAPKMEVKMKKADQLMRLRSQVNELQSESDFLSKYSDQLLDFTPEEERQLSLALPDKFDLPSIVVQLSKLASAHSLVVDNIQAAEAVSNGMKNNKIKRVDIEMTINGVGGNDYDNFSNFIKALESSLLIFDVRSISFTSEEDSYVLGLFTYYYPNQL